jgi:hypothetical protein
MSARRGLLLALALTACSDDGQGGGFDAAPDLALPPQVTHIGVREPACCLQTTRSAWRVMYLASPKPGGSDSRGRDVATKGQLHLADAYGADLTLGEDVPRDGYAFSPDGRLVMYLTPVGTRGDASYKLNFAALSADTLGSIDPIVVIPRGLEDRPLDHQAFFSPTGRFLIVGVGQPDIENSTDLTVVEVATARVLVTLPGGSFNYIEQVTSNDVMVFQNSTASKTLGTPSVVGLYVLPLASAGTGQPARIDTRTISYALTGDEQRVVYTRYDGTLWMYDLRDKSRVQLAAGVASFSLGYEANGPLMWVDQARALHVTRLLQPELLATDPRSVDVWSSTVFSPSGQDLYFFNSSQTQDFAGDLYRLSLAPGASTTPTLIDRRVGWYDLSFVGQRMRFLRNLDGRGEIGELVSTNLDGSDLRSLARGVAAGAVLVANPQPVEPPPPRGNPPRGPLDLLTPIIPPVYAHLVDAQRDTSRSQPLFDESEPIVGALAFARADQPAVTLDPAVHVGGYRFSPDGYVLVYAGGARLDGELAAYLGTLRLHQTLVDQAPVSPMLDGVSEIGSIRDRAFFVAAPAASPPGVYFVRY